MRALIHPTAPLPMAAVAARRTFATRAGTVDTFRRRRHGGVFSGAPQDHPRPRHQPGSGADIASASQSGAGIMPFGSDRAGRWESSPHAPRTLPDDRARSFYSTHIYHGQAPDTGSGSGGGGSAGAKPDIDHDRNNNNPKTPKGNPNPNPTESEADVAADRSDDDPLPPGLHHTIRMPAGDTAPRPTESEEDVAADRGVEDPLAKKK